MLYIWKWGSAGNNNLIPLGITIDTSECKKATNKKIGVRYFLNIADCKNRYT